VGGDELRGYAEQLLRDRHGGVEEPLAWLQRMEAFRGDHWNGAAHELRRDRDSWDLPT
jgi:hypothetical protein